jgi:hypothetical protein
MGYSLHPNVCGDRQHAGSDFGEHTSLLKNSFVLSSAPGSGAEYVVFVAFWPCFRISWTDDRTDDYFLNTLTPSTHSAE